MTDAAGRPVRSVYPDGDEERYRYDDAGRLVEIDEASALLDSIYSSPRWETGGRLRVEHDERGLCARDDGAERTRRAIPRGCLGTLGGHRGIMTHASHRTAAARPM